MPSFTPFFLRECIIDLTMLPNHEWMGRLKASHSATAAGPWATVPGSQECCLEVTYAGQRPDTHSEPVSYAQLLEAEVRWLLRPKLGSHTMRLGELEVNILCEGRPLAEYRPAQQDARTIACFIPSEAGKAFKVVTKHSGALHAVVGKLKLDGCRVRTFRAMPASTHTADCVYLSQFVSRPFLFSEMTLADDGADLRSTVELLEHVGIIQVDFFRCEMGPDVPWQSRGPKDMDLGQLPRGCGTHQISLGNHEHKGKRLSGMRAKLLDPKDHPYASFIFRYQSRAILHAHGAIQRPLSEALVLPRRTDRDQYVYNQRRSGQLLDVPWSINTLDAGPSFARPRPMSVCSESTLVEWERFPRQPTPSSFEDGLMSSIESAYNRSIACGTIGYHRPRGMSPDGDSGSLTEGSDADTASVVGLDEKGSKEKSSVHEIPVLETHGKGTCCIIC